MLAHIGKKKKSYYILIGLQIPVFFYVYKTTSRLFLFFRDEQNGPNLLQKFNPRPPRKPTPGRINKESSTQLV